MPRSAEPRKILRQRAGDRVEERLSLARCRKLLDPECPLSDDQLLQLRNQLYNVAEVVVSVASITHSRDAIEKGAPITEFDDRLPAGDVNCEGLILYRKGRQ